MNIKEFLGDNPLESVTQDAETAGKLAASGVGWKVENDWLTGYLHFHLPTQIIAHPVAGLSKNLNLVSELETAVIEKVGQSKLAHQIWNVLFSSDMSLWRSDTYTMVIARATAVQRLTAILLALSEFE